MICFKMISNLGAARSSFMEAIKEAKAYRFEEARNLMKEGNEYYQKGHDVHFELLTKESTGEQSTLTLLLMHAEDQLMSSEVIQLMAQESIHTYEKFYQLEQYRKEETR